MSRGELECEALELALVNVRWRLKRYTPPVRWSVYLYLLETAIEKYLKN